MKTSQPVCVCACGYFGSACQFSTNPLSTNFKNWCEAVDFQCPIGKTCFVQTDESYCGLACRTSIENNDADDSDESSDSDDDSGKKNSAMIIALSTSVPLAVIIILVTLVAVICSHMRKRNPNSSCFSCRRQASAGHTVSAISGTVINPPNYDDIVMTPLQSPPTYEEACEHPPGYNESVIP